MASAALPATRVAPAPTMITGGAVSARPNRSKAPVLIGASAVVVGALVAVAVFARGTPSSATVPTETTASSPARTAGDTSQTVVRPSDSSGLAQGSRQGGPSSGLASRPVTETVAPRSIESALSPADVRRAIDEIKRLSAPGGAADSPSAAIASANRLLPKLRDGGDSVETLYYRAQAQGINDESGACETFRLVASRARAMHHRLVPSIDAALQACTP
jgi:hypothetical protein